MVLNHAHGPWGVTRFLLFTGAACAPGLTARAADGAADSASDSGLSSANPAPTARDIVVFGRREDGSIDGIVRDNELDAGDVAALGVNTIGDVIDALGIRGTHAG